MTLFVSQNESSDRLLEIMRAIAVLEALGRHAAVFVLMLVVGHLPSRYHIRPLVPLGQGD